MTSFTSAARGASPRVSEAGIGGQLPVRQAARNEFNAVHSLQRSVGNQALQRVALGEGDLTSCGGGCQGTCPDCKNHIIQAKLTIGSIEDPYEQEADRVANAISDGHSGPVALKPAGGSHIGIQQKCQECEQDDESKRSHQGGYPSADLADIMMIGGLPSGTVQRLASSGQGKEIDDSDDLISGPGKSIPDASRQYFEERLGYDFGAVRVHDDTAAARTASSLGALAFTTGRDIVFGTGQYSPQSQSGRHLLAHELTHVVQQGQAGPIAGTKSSASIALGVQRQAAPAQAAPAPVVPGGAVPPVADAPLLDAAQTVEAITFNQGRFKDPWDIRTVRELMGIELFPAVVDEPFVQAVAQWQTSHPPLTPDGKVGADTTRTYLVQLRADAHTRLAKDLAEDNSVTTSTVAGPTFNVCPTQPGFQWDVLFATTLRSGFIVQEVISTFNGQHCDGTPFVGPRPTLHYWEAWQVDANGHVTPNGGFNDRWSRSWCNATTGPPQCANKATSGSWTMASRLFTPLTLPPAANFVAGAVPDAGILLSTVTRPNSDHLGLVAGSRQIGGRWNCCPPANTHVRT